MKKILIVATFLAMQLNGADKPRTAILVKNDSGLNVDFSAYYQQAEPVSLAARISAPEPQQVTNELSAGESILLAPDEAGRPMTKVEVSRRVNSNELTLKAPQYTLLTTGRAYLQIVSLGGDYVAIKFVPVDRKTYGEEVANVGKGKPKEIEQKKGAIPGGVQAEAMEIVEYRAQLKKCKDDLAAAQARVRMLEARLAEYEPGA